MATARPGEPIMSKEAMVDELWGDSKDEDWKQEEINRLSKDEVMYEETPFPTDDAIVEA